MSILVFDIGGTNLRSALYEKDGSLRDIKIRQSPSFLMYDTASGDELQLKLIQIVEYCVNKYRNIYNIKDIGISFPGPVMPNGDVLCAPSLWSDRVASCELSKILNQKLKGVNIYIVNDITAAGWRYVGDTNSTFCIITISSGVGNKIFWNGEVVLSPNGKGGEMGHIKYNSSDYSGLVCDCGGYGHISSISSGRGIEKIFPIVSEKNKNIFKESPLNNGKSATTYDIADALKKGDPFSRILLKESIKPIAYEVHQVYLLMGVMKFIIIGGFAMQIGSEYIDFLKDEMRAIHSFSLDESEIDDMFSLGAADDHNGLIGMGKYINNIKEKSIA